MRISQAVDLWLGELERQNYSVRTLGTYRPLLFKLADAFPMIDVEELTTEQLRRFLTEQGKKKDGSRKAPATVAQSVSTLNGFYEWLLAEKVVRRNPSARIKRPKQIPAGKNDNVVSVSENDVEKLIAEADRGGRWDERLAVYVLAALGPRRHAVAIVRLRNYDLETRSLLFHEKGSKAISKPCPEWLADLIEAAITAGVYESLDDYLVPSRAQQRRKGDRDDRVIWRLVRQVAARAGVTTHVHALRGAFAVQYLTNYPDQVVALQELMGHERLDTTMGYARRLNRRQQMESVRDLPRYGAKHGSSPSLSRRRRDSNPRSEPDQSQQGLEPIAQTPDGSCAHPDLTAALLERIQILKERAAVPE